MANFEHHHRRLIRLKDYDYSQDGAYFVTICSYQRARIFGEIVESVMRANEWGRIIIEEWERTAILRSNVALDTFVVMPNHLHGIIVINNEMDEGKARGMMHYARTDDVPNMDNGGKREFSKPIGNSLAAIVGTFKAAVTRRINRLAQPPDNPIWQRNYYEHIIRNEKSLNYIRWYVANNPARWAEDSLAEVE